MKRLLFKAARTRERRPRGATPPTIPVNSLHSMFEVSNSNRSPKSVPGNKGASKYSARVMTTVASGSTQGIIGDIRKLPRIDATLRQVVGKVYRPMQATAMIALLHDRLRLPLIF